MCEHTEQKAARERENNQTHKLDLDGEFIKQQQHTGVCGYIREREASEREKIMF